MSTEAQKRLERWVAWLGPSCSDAQLDKMKELWEQGVEPPQRPYSADWDGSDG